MFSTLVPNTEQRRPTPHFLFAPLACVSHTRPLAGLQPAGTTSERHVSVTKRPLHRHAARPCSACWWSTTGLPRRIAVDQPLSAALDPYPLPPTQRGDYKKAKGETPKFAGVAESGRIPESGGKPLFGDSHTIERRMKNGPSNMQAASPEARWVAIQILSQVQEILGVVPFVIQNGAICYPILYSVVFVCIYTVSGGVSCHVFKTVFLW